MDQEVLVTHLVVDNHVLLLGLDNLYRNAMKEHERTELLDCARETLRVLGLQPSTVPVEGYYAEDQELTDYFLIMRALQVVADSRTPEVVMLDEYQRLLDVTSSPIYGQPQNIGCILPTGRDALHRALAKTMPDWTIAKVTAAAYTSAQETDDISLVGLAARAKDPVALAAMRESVVLYAMPFLTGLPVRREYVYEWHVDDDLTDYAKRSIDVFNKLFGEQLPAPEAVNAEIYWREYSANKIMGRCVRIAVDVQDGQSNHYHWAIDTGDDDKDIVKEFWDTDIWTTERYCKYIGRDYLTRDPFSQLIQESNPDQE